MALKKYIFVQIKLILLQVNNVIIAKDFEALQKYLSKNEYSKLFILTDTNTRKHCLPLVKELLPSAIIITIKAGDENKSIPSTEKIWSTLNQNFADKNSLLINLGGGMITDLGGFAASTYKRGIKFIHVPTSLMAMCDAAIGGKTAINFSSIKNNIGSFHLPESTFINHEFLKTLPERELKNGLAEIIKHCILQQKTNWLKKILNEQELTEIDWFKLIQHSVKYKLSIVKNDFKETGERKLLNFGHTIGHAIESYYQSQKSKKIMHGEAVAIGMWVEIILSNLCLQYPAIKANDLFDIIEFYFGYKKFDNKTKDEILPFLLHDKKNKNNLINFTLLQKNGVPVIDCLISIAVIKHAIYFY
ncbi:MAG: 3-dehydroquinate synthase [Bacteroidota bacterium]